MSAEGCTLERFLRGEVAARDFPHREHVRMAFELLLRHEFTETAHRYAQALRLITARAGKPQAFNLTLTIAFLALIAERMEGSGHADFAAFAQAHPELFARDVLARWYRPEQLATALARRSFVLPDLQSPRR